MIKALIFDFNGVLVDDESVHFELFREVLEQEGVVITERDYHEHYLGYDDRGCFAAALGDAQQAFDEQRLADLIARKARRYVEVAEKGLRYFPSAAETLTNLAKHWPIAICSGALRAEIEYALKRLDRRDHVAAIITAEDAHKCKPDPAGYLQALDALRGYLQARSRSSADTGSTFAPNLQARDCLVIEDSLAGILSAKGAGMHAVGISHTYNPVQLRQSGADAVIDGLETLTPEWIHQRFSPTGLLLSRDLIFTSKITGTARELGYQVLVAGNVSLARTMIEQQRPRAILVDLAAGDMVSPESLAAYQQLAGPETPLIAFGSHVDTQSLAAARAAGCAEVMPRSKLSAELPALIRRLLG